MTKPKDKSEETEKDIILDWSVFSSQELGCIIRDLCLQDNSYKTIRAVTKLLTALTKKRDRAAEYQKKKAKAAVAAAAAANTAAKEIPAQPGLENPNPLPASIGTETASGESKKRHRQASTSDSRYRISKNADYR